MNCASSCLRRLMSRLIGQPLASDPLERDVGALVVGVAKAGPMREAEIKLSDVALQMRFADVVVSPIQATLENAEERFDGIGMHHYVFRLLAFLRVFLLSV